MDSIITIVIVSTFMFTFPSSVHPIPAIYNRGVDNGLYASGSLWHVFRQVHASDLAIGRTIIPSNSSKVVEKTIIIPKEESKSLTASFTIISRIQPPAGWATSKPMRPVNGVMNVVSIGARIKPDKTSTEDFNKKSSQPFDGELMKRTSPWDNSDVPPDESESLIKEEAAANASSTPAAANLDGFYSVRNGQIQFHDAHHQRDVEGGGIGRNRPAAEPINILWEKFVPEELRQPQKQSADKMTTNRSDRPVENDGENGNRLDDHLTSLITQQYLESPLLVQDNDRLVIRVNATTIYVADTSFPNGTIIFELSMSNSSIPKGANWKNLTEAEEMYPGFTKMASIRPVRVIIDGSDRNTVTEKEVIKDDVPTSVKIDDKQTVLVPSTSPWSSINNGTSIISRNQNGSIKPIETNKVLKKPDTSTSPTVITEIPSGPIDEQMAPPVLPPLTQPQPSSSSTSSSSSWLVQYSQPGENQPISDWGMAGQVMQRPRLQPSNSTATSSTTSTPSSTTITTRKSTTTKSTTTTRRPTTTTPSSTTTIPSTTTSTPSSTTKTTTSWKPIDPDPIAASMQIVSYLLGSSTEQSLVTAVADQPPLRSPLASTQPSSIQIRPSYANNNKSLILSYSNKLEPLPLSVSPKEEGSSSGTGGGLASLILAHTAALIAGKPSPFGRQPGVLKQPVSVPAAAPNNKTSSSVPGVHIILATALPDHVEPEDDYRYRSLDSSIESNETKTMSKDSSGSNWAFPSFNQLINSADSFLSSALSPFFPVKSVDPPAISSYNESAPMDPVLPLLPRFSCGQETSMDESVLTNPSFPEPDSSSGHCTFRLRVTSNNVCQVRVGFQESRMLLPRQGFCKDQHLSVSGSIVAHPSGVENKFCGWNSDQHFYLELTDPEEEEQRVVEFNIDTQVSGHLYRYSLIIQQIQCSPVAHPAKAPRGCLQYFYSGRSGTIKSFNYDGRQYWNKQSYRICVRSVDQSCTLTLTSRNGDFGLMRAGGLDRAGVGSEACPQDYLWIPGSVRSDRNAESNLQDRYCGPKLSDRNGDPQSGPVVVRMYSSVHIMEFRTETPVKYDETTRGPGFKISFTQTDECPTGIARIPEEGLMAITTTTEGKDGFDEIYNSLQRLRQLQLD